jgi:RNA polymerase sigma-70 factor (ECF subfamily)
MDPSPEEQTLIERAIQRDPEAFAELYVKYHDAVLRRVRRVIGNQQEAFDITSEVFLRAWNTIERYEDRGLPIIAWLGTIGQRLAITYLTKRRWNLTLDQIEFEAHKGDTPEELAERRSVAASLQNAMVELPDLQREVLSRRFMEQLTYDEIGAIIGKRPGTVRVIQHRALRALRLIVQRNSDFEPV